MSNDLKSKCCSASPVNMVVEGMGFCSKCRKWVGFSCVNCRLSLIRCHCDDDKTLIHKEKPETRK